MNGFFEFLEIGFFTRGTRDYEANDFFIEMREIKSYRFVNLASELVALNGFLVDFFADANGKLRQSIRFFVFKNQQSILNELAFLKKFFDNLPVADAVLFIEHSLNTELLSPFAASTIDRLLTSFGTHSCLEAMPFVHFSLVSFAEHLYFVKKALPSYRKIQGFASLMWQTEKVKSLIRVKGFI